MSRFLRFFGVIIVAVACAFGVAAPRVGYADPTYPFTVTTTPLSANTTFTFTISAAGTFYVDWGDNSPEQTIDHTGNSYPAADVISHTYTNAGTYTIGLRGSATAYSSDDFIPAVQFGNESGNTNSCQYVRGISGSLGAIFPTIGSDVPGFPDVFNGCTHITSLPGNLFQGVTGARPFMFMGTFARMGITSIPANLFSGISGAEEAMFAQTFVGNDYLTSLPSGLFSGVTGTASDLFREAFRDCKRLSGYIPKNLFNLGSGGLTYNAGNDMMNGVFSGLNKLAVSCDSYNLTQYTTSFDSYFGGKVVCVPVATFMCEQWTGSLPSPISVDPVTSGNVTFTLPSGSMCESYLGYTIDNRWTCEEAVCNNRSWSSDGTAVFNENWDGSTNLHFYMMYTPNVYTITLNEFLDDGNGNNLATPGSVTTLYEEYNTGWSTNSNGPFGRDLTLSASDLPTANGFTFLGWYVNPNTSGALRIVDAGGHVVGEPTLNTYHGNTTLYSRWESDTGPFNVTVQCGENATWASGFNHSQVDSQSVAYGGSVVLPAVGACVQEGFYFTQWKIDTNGERVNAGANNNTSYTWAHRFSSVISPDWQNIETTITLNPQNTTNASGTSGTTALYTIATNYIDDYGVYLDSARTQHMYTINDGMLNNFIAPTKSVTLSLNLNDSVASPASIQYFTDGVAVEPSCIGGGVLNGTNITVPLGFAGYYSVANGGTQYIEKGNSANDGWYLASDGFDAGVAYTTDTTWYGQWNAANPFDVCRKIDHVIPVRPGYTFAGWWTAASGGTRIDTGETGLIGQASNWTIDSNTTIYAHWDVATYTVTLDKNGVDAVVGSVTTLYEKYNAGWSVDNNANSTFTAGLTLSGNQLPTRSGYLFMGYYDAATGGNMVGTYSNETWTAPAATTFASNVTLYAHWDQPTYNITYNYNGGTVGSSALPAGYTRVEYLQSDGNQIINTGIVGLYTRVVIDAQYTGTDNSLDILAGYDADYVGEYVGVYSKKWTLYTNGNGSTTVSALDRANVSVVFDRDTNDDNHNRATITVGGETVTITRSTVRSGNTIKLFHGRSSAGSYGFVGRIYRAMIYKNDSDVVIFDGVPVRRNSDNALGIYDTVSGTFLENVGTGTFTAGADITTPYPATYTHGTGATVYGMPVRANSVFVGWCRDSALSTGCGMPHEIAATAVGDVALYAKWDCVYGYSANAQTGQCESTPMFTVTTTQIEPGTVFKFNLGARGTFVVDWGDGTQPQIINSNTVADTQYTHTYAADAFGGMATKSFTIGFSGRGVEYSSASTVSTIKFFNATVDEDGEIVSDDQGNLMNGSEFYIASISGSLGAMFPVIGNGGTNATTPSFYQTFRNAKNMSQTMASLADLFDGINGVPRAYMFYRTFQGCSGLTGSIPENLFGRVVNGTYYGINGTPASYMFYGTFYGCSGLTGNIPENLFGRTVNGTYYGINGAPASYMFSRTFYGCSGLTGNIPENLFGRVVNGTYYGINGAPATNMFREIFRGCSGLTGTIPENLFVGINGAPASYMFLGTFYGCSGLTGSIPGNLFAGISGAPKMYMFHSTFYGCSGLTGSIPENLFGRVVNGGYVGINGTPASYMFRETFYGCSGLTGPIPENLFGRTVNGTYYGISGTPANGMFYSTFKNCSRLSGEIPSYLFGHISGNAAAHMFRETFRGCSGLTGTIPGNLFGGQNLTGPASTYVFYHTFYGCRNLSGYVPANLFGQMTLPATPPTGMMSYVFYNTGLETSCPCGTTQVTSSPFRTYWSGKVSCAPGLDVGQHWYNGQCTTMCSDSSIDELHVGGLSAFPVLADKITTPSINVKLGNTQCYVPLATGNGGTNSFNISYDGNVYHADRPDDITPVGFGQRD